MAEAREAEMRSRGDCSTFENLTNPNLQRFQGGVQFCFKDLIVVGLYDFKCVCMMKILGGILLVDISKILLADSSTGRQGQVLQSPESLRQLIYCPGFSIMKLFLSERGFLLIRLGVSQHNS